MQFFYHPELTKQTDYKLSDEECKHVVKVLRSKTGDKVYVTDGNGNLATAELFVKSKNEAFAKTVDIISHNPSNNLLGIAISPIKSSSRWEWFLEKATELGISRIQPIICARTEKKNLNMERSERVIIAAMKQSQRVFKPVLSDSLLFDDYIKNEKIESRFIAHCFQSPKKHISDALGQKKRTFFMVGPEGDFTKEEIDLAAENNFQAVSLGESRLRTETAGIVICQSFNFAHRL